MARKMSLVPKEMLANFEAKKEALNTQTNNPVLDEAVHLDREMKTVLDQKNLPEDVKMKLYGQALGRFLTFYKQQSIMAGNPPQVDNIAQIPSSVGKRPLSSSMESSSNNGHSQTGNANGNHTGGHLIKSRTVDFEDNQLHTPTDGSTPVNSLSFTSPQAPKLQKKTVPKRKNLKTLSVKKWLKY